jgi:hypothetical protein
MSKFSKLISILFCALIASSAMACERRHSAINQNGSDKIIAQLRHSWKNSTTKQVAAHALKLLITVDKSKARSKLTQVKRATNS